MVGPVRQVSTAKPVVAFAAETEEKFGGMLSREEVKLARTNRLGKLLGINVSTA